MLQQLVYNGSALTLLPLNSVDIKQYYYRHDYTGYKVYEIKSSIDTDNIVKRYVLVHPVNPIACYDFVVNCLPTLVSTEENGIKHYEYVNNLNAFLSAYGSQLDNSFIAVVQGLINSNTYYQG